LYEVAQGVEYLHCLKFIHGDLRGVRYAITQPHLVLFIYYQANILIDSDRRPRIADFGLAEVADATAVSINQCGSVRWMAPELLETFQRTLATDVYAFACVCLEVSNPRLNVG
jgi:serine/threonine protein kinase